MAPDLEPQVVVIFGASGDLTARKLLPAFYHLFEQRMLPDGFAIVGSSRTKMTDEDFAEHARASIAKHAPRAPEGRAWDGFAERLSYVPADLGEPMALQALQRHLRRVGERHGIDGGRFFYAATPPVAYPDIARRIAEVGLQQGARIVFEKPYGHDVETARELDDAVHEVFDERQIFRIDHYLGKETVQNILAFRFANGMFEPIWNRQHIDHVEITVAETIGIEGRGSFYEQTGAIRDVMSTHLFQVLTFVAMEPPVALEPDRLRDETVKLLRSTDACRPDRMVRGQYLGYRDEEGVARDSMVETFAAMQVEINNWRWAGVPFFLRTGKALPRKVTEITLKFRKVPFSLFAPSQMTLAKRDHLTIRVQPNEGITLALNAKLPGPGMRMGRVTMEFDYAEDFAHHPIADAYELLILEVMRGDHSLFIRQDGVVRAWEILQPVLDHPTPVIPYEPGTWGPPEADALIAPHRWHVTAEHLLSDEHDAARRADDVRS